MFWPQPDSIESDDTLMLSPEPLIPCWPNDRWPGPGCPGMIISHIRLSVSERPLSVRGGGQVPWLITASGPGLGTSSWDFHIPALAASSPALSGVLWTVWTLRYSRHCHTRFTSVLKNSPPFHPFVPPRRGCWQWLSQFYLLFQIRGWVQTSLGAGAGGWETRSRSRRLDWAHAAGYRSCSGSRAGSPGSWWWPLVPGPGPSITARHIITRSHDQHKTYQQSQLIS